MPSSGRHILDIKKKAPASARSGSSRTKARAQMPQLFSAPARPKPVRLRHKRQRQRLIATAAGIVAVFALFSALAGASHLEQFAIGDIGVAGAKTVSPEELAAAAAAAIHDERFHLFSRENMFLYPRAEIERAIVGTYPRIKAVTVERPSLLAQSVLVAVEERVPYALWCDRECFVMDETGYIFAEDDGRATRISYSFSGGLAPGYMPVGQWFLRGRLSNVVALVERMRAAGYETVAVSVDSEKDLSLRLAEGPRIMIPFALDADTVVRNLEIARATDALSGRFADLEYVDLRFGSRVYYK